MLTLSQLERAAIKIQAAGRGMIARKEVEERRKALEEKKAALAAQESEVAAEEVRFIAGSVRARRSFIFQYTNRGRKCARLHLR